MTNLTLEIVVAARALIEKKENWGKGRFAGERDGQGDILEAPAYGYPAIYSDERPPCFCGRGAIRRAAFEAKKSIDFAADVDDEFLRASKDCVPKHFRSELSGNANFAEFNDALETTHEEVLGAFDCLIAKLRAES